MKSLRAQKISETMRRKQANKYGLSWLPASRGTPLENKFVTAWDDMKARCSKKEHSQYYNNYGNRGINFSGEWSTFAYFFRDMWSSYIVHIRMHGLKNTSLDRVDNNKGYSKKNCRWSTREEQQYNRINTIRIKDKTLGEWSKELKIDRKVLYRRYWSHLPIDQVLSKVRLVAGRKKLQTS
jgi:hypothetical protein